MFKFDVQEFGPGTKQSDVTLCLVGDLWKTEFDTLDKRCFGAKGCPKYLKFHVSWFVDSWRVTLAPFELSGLLSSVCKSKVCWSTVFFYSKILQLRAIWKNELLSWKAKLSMASCKRMILLWNWLKLSGLIFGHREKNSREKTKNSRKKLKTQGKN